MPLRNGCAGGSGRRARLKAATAWMPLVTPVRISVSDSTSHIDLQCLQRHHRSRGNGVNMGVRRYHHGDLRAALVDAGLTLLAERDVESLSPAGGGAHCRRKRNRGLPPLPGQNRVDVGACARGSRTDWAPRSIPLPTRRVAARQGSRPQDTPMSGLHSPIPRCSGSFSLRQHWRIHRAKRKLCGSCAPMSPQTSPKAQKKAQRKSRRSTHGHWFMVLRP